MAGRLAARRSQRAPAVRAGLLMKSSRRSPGRFMVAADRRRATGRDAAVSEATDRSLGPSPPSLTLCLPPSVTTELLIERRSRNIPSRAFHLSQAFTQCERSPRQPRRPQSQPVLMHSLQKTDGEINSDNRQSSTCPARHSAPRKYLRSCLEICKNCGQQIKYQVDRFSARAHADL